MPILVTMTESSTVRIQPTIGAAHVAAQHKMLTSLKQICDAQARKPQKSSSIVSMSLWSQKSIGLWSEFR
jgi:hypothetical protein